MWHLVGEAKGKLLDNWSLCACEELRGFSFQQCFHICFRSWDFSFWFYSFLWILCGSPWCQHPTSLDLKGVRGKRFMSSRRWSFSQMLLPKFHRCQHALATWDTLGFMVCPIQTKCFKGWKMRTSPKFPRPEVLMLDPFFMRTWLGDWQRLVAKSHAQKVPPHLVMPFSMFSSMISMPRQKG